jgi:hypothetical protein
MCHSVTHRGTFANSDGDHAEQSVLGGKFGAYAAQRAERKDSV